MKLAIGCDEAAFEMKEAIKAYVVRNGHEVLDCGTYDEEEKVLYPDIALKTAALVAAGKAERGILMCGTGLGMSITANKVHGVYATVCHDCYSAERSIRSNNANMLCMGARVIGIELAKMLVDIWLRSTFDGGRSLPKVERMHEIEKRGA